VIPGTLVAAAGPDEDPIAIGVISVPTRNLSLSGKGLLGIRMDDAEDGVMIASENAGLPGVTKGSAADKAGLREGDLIIAVDGTPIRAPRDLQSYISGKKPEDSVRITYKRDGKEYTTLATLGSQEDIRQVIEERRQLMREGDLTARMGGRGNSVADGFPSALQNDLFIKPNECGGPIVGIDGAALGINIARAERTKTFAIPANTLKELLANVKDGKFNVAADVSELKRAARLANEGVESARQKLREAEEKARAAEEALKEHAN
jgi:serine protease Do